jgi:hypothetical protein
MDSEIKAKFLTQRPNLRQNRISHCPAPLAQVGAIAKELHERNDPDTIEIATV